MPSLHDISAWIEVDGKVLEEYGVEVDHVQSQVTCYIAAQVGKNFSVIFEDNVTDRVYSLCSDVLLDGSSIGGRIMHPQNFSDRKEIQSDQLTSATSARPFVFSKLELTDDDELLDQASSHLGEISIRICRGQALDLIPFDPGSITSGHGKIHERSKKAVSHCVSYGEEVKTVPQSIRRVRYLDGDIPLVSFVFKYRDSSLLQANGIMPRPPRAENKAVIANEVFDLTIDDDVKPRGSSKRRGTTLKNEARPKKKIKRERNAVLSGEIIDLT